MVLSVPTNAGTKVLRVVLVLVEWVVAAPISLVLDAVGI